MFDISLFFNRNLCSIFETRWVCDASLSVLCEVARRFSKSEKILLGTEISLMIGGKDKLPPFPKVFDGQAICLPILVNQNHWIYVEIAADRVSFI